MAMVYYRGELSGMEAERVLWSCVSLSRLCQAPKGQQYPRPILPAKAMFRPIREADLVMEVVKLMSVQKSFNKSSSPLQHEQTPSRVQGKRQSEIFGIMHFPCICFPVFPCFAWKYHGGKLLPLLLVTWHASLLPYQSIECLARKAGAPAKCLMIQVHINFVGQG